MISHASLITKTILVRPPDKLCERRKFDVEEDWESKIGGLLRVVFDNLHRVCMVHCQWITARPFYSKSKPTWVVIAEAYAKCSQLNIASFSSISEP